MKYFLYFLFAILLIIPLAYAHGDELEQSNFLLTESSPLVIVIIASIIIAIFVIFSLFLQKYGFYPRIKKWMFIGILIPILLASIFIIFQTIYINLISVTNGPIHWHADIEIYACNERLDLVNPMGFSNKVGTNLFHEHADDRIHIEGAVFDYEDITLHKFFEVIGGELASEKLMLHTENKGIAEFNNGDTCSNGEKGSLQGFLYKTDEATKTYHQEKIENFEDYVISPYGLVPPGDCIVIEFGSIKEKTENICETYRIARDGGEIIES